MKKFSLCVLMSVFVVMIVVSSSEALSLQEQTPSNIAFKPFYGGCSVGLTFSSNWISCTATATSKETYAWSVVGGSLPPGLYLACSDMMHFYDSSYEHNKGKYGHIAGIPTKAGTYTFTLRVDSSGGDFAINQYTIQIAGGGNDYLPDPDPTPAPETEPDPYGSTPSPVKSSGGGGCNSFAGLELIAILALAFRRSR